MTFYRGYKSANGGLFGTQTITLVKTRSISQTMAPLYGVALINGLAI